MSINMMQWRAGTGNFYRYAYHLTNMNKSLLSLNFDISLILLNLFYSLFYQILLLLHGDVEQILVLIKNISLSLVVIGM